MTHHSTHLIADVAGRGAQAFGLMHVAVEGFFDGLKQRRLEDLDATSRLIAEVGIARRAAAAAIAEADRLRDEAARLRADLRSANAGLVAERARADRLHRSLSDLVGAVRRDRAAA